MSDSESENSVASDLSENEEQEADEEVQEEESGLVEPEDDEESEVTWEDMVRIGFAFSSFDPRVCHS